MTNPKDIETTDAAERVAAWLGDVNEQAYSITNPTVKDDLRALLAENARLKATVQPEVQGKPFGYIVRSVARDATYQSIFRQRVFNSEHDQEQCYRQWMEHFGKSRAMTSGESSVWWEVSKHTVYEPLGRIVEAQPATEVRPSTEWTKKLVFLLNSLKPNYGDVGSRDDEVAAQRNQIEAAISMLTATTAQTAVAPSPAAVPGWKLVPIQPTDEMRDRGNEVMLDRGKLFHVWSLMLAAAPVPPVAAVMDELSRFESWARTSDGNCSEQDLRKLSAGNHNRVVDGCEFVSQAVERDWNVWQARAAQSAPVRTKLTPMQNDDEEVAGIVRQWYFDSDNFYIDVAKDENGKYSIFCKTRSDGKEGWHDQAEQSAPVPPSVQEGNPVWNIFKELRAALGVPDDELHNMDTLYELIRQRSSVQVPDASCRFPMCQSTEVQEQIAVEAANSLFGVQVPDIVPWEQRLSADGEYRTKDGIYFTSEFAVQAARNAELSDHRAFIAQLKGNTK